MKIALLGYGKMGHIIEELAVAQGDEVVLRVDADNRNSVAVDDLKVADVAIEFSRPEAAVGNILLALAAGVPVVCGTTGWLDKLPTIEAAIAEHQGAFFYASNYSIGVNVFFAVNEYLAKLMGKLEQYNVSLSETHHTQKLDAPSGTAITLAEAIVAEHTTLKGWQLKEEIWVDPSPEQYIATVNKDIASMKSKSFTTHVPITSYRQKDVPGTHLIEYRSKQDSLRIEHQAHSREGFALGAIAAARWIIGKQGMFGMKDLLELEQL